jgi:hypothetical protein
VRRGDSGAEPARREKEACRQVSFSLSGSRAFPREANGHRMSTTPSAIEDAEALRTGLARIGKHVSSMNVRGCNPVPCAEETFAKKSGGEEKPNASARPYPFG